MESWPAPGTSASVALKVCCADRSIIKGLIAHSYTDLLIKCRHKFHVDENTSIKVVMVEDGCEIDEDFYRSLPALSNLMLLVGEETWSTPSGFIKEKSVTGENVDTKPSLLDLVTKIRNKQTNLYQQKVKKRPKTQIKIKMGWLLWSGGKYIQVRQKTGGGVYPVNCTGETTNSDLLEKGKELFYPNGQNSWKGQWGDLQHEVGDFKLNVFSDQTTLSEFLEEHGNTTTPRIYLLSKKEEDEDISLPDINLDIEPDVEAISDILLLTSRDGTQVNATGQDDNVTTMPHSLHTAPAPSTTTLPHSLHTASAPSTTTLPHSLHTAPAPSTTTLPHSLHPAPAPSTTTMPHSLHTAPAPSTTTMPHSLHPAPAPSTTTMPHSLHTAPAPSTTTMSHSLHTAPAPSTTTMSHSLHTAPAPSTTTMPHSLHTAPAPSTTTMPHSLHTAPAPSTTTMPHSLHTAVSDINQEDTGDNTSVNRSRLGLGRRRAALRCRQNMAYSLQRSHLRNTSGFDQNSTSSRNHEIIEVIDSEDEELQRALQESFDDRHVSRPEIDADTAVTLLDVLKAFQSNINSESTQEIIISRRHVLQSTFRALRRRFDSGCKLYVKFSGEMGLDYGGPRREFFRLVVHELSHSSLFEGREGSKFFTHDLKKLQDNEYYLAGRIIGMSILHEGPSACCFQEHLAKMMLGMVPDFESFDLNLLVDDEWREKLTELKTLDNFEKRDKFLSENGDWMINQGYSNAWRMTIDDCDVVVEALIKQFIYYRTLAEITQFTEGLDEVFGLWSTMRKHPETCLELMTNGSKQLDKEAFINLLKIEWSAEGSNQKQMEEDTIYSWEIFLQDVQDKTVEISFEDILIFTTGADVVPPCGFPSKISIQFYTNDAGINRLPFTSTCAMTLSLPRGFNNPDNFQKLMVRSLKESSGFDKM